MLSLQQLARHLVRFKLLHCWFIYPNLTNRLWILLDFFPYFIVNPSVKIIILPSIKSYPYFTRAWYVISFIMELLKLYHLDTIKITTSFNQDLEGLPWVYYLYYTGCVMNETCIQHGARTGLKCVRVPYRSRVT